MKTFKETLKLAKENDISAVKLTIATEVAENIPDCSFEKVCGFIEECYYDSGKDITIAELVMCFKSELEENTEEELVSMRTYKFIDKASYYHE